MITLEYLEKIVKAASTEHSDAERISAIKKLLADKDIKINSSVREINGSISTPLILAIKRENIKAIRTLIAAGAGVNIIARSSPITVAAERDNLEIINILLENKADVNQNIAGTTALHRASAQGNVATVEALIAAGAAVNATNQLHKQTPLFDCITTASPEVVKILLKHKADVNHKDMDGNTALHYAAADGLTSIVHFLITAGASVEAINNEQQTPLIMAVENTHLNAIKLLLQNNANVVHKDKTGKTALFHAALDGQIDITYSLLASGASTDDVLSITDDRLSVKVLYGTRTFFERQISKNKLLKLLHLIMIFPKNFLHFLAIKSEKIYVELEKEHFLKKNELIQDLVINETLAAKKIFDSLYQEETKSRREHLEIELEDVNRYFHLVLADYLTSNYLARRTENIFLMPIASLLRELDQANKLPFGINNLIASFLITPSVGGLEKLRTLKKGEESPYSEQAVQATTTVLMNWRMHAAREFLLAQSVDAESKGEAESLTVATFTPPKVPQSATLLFEAHQETASRLPARSRETIFNSLTQFNNFSSGAGAGSGADHLLNQMPSHLPILPVYLEESVGTDQAENSIYKRKYEELD